MKIKTFTAIPVLTLSLLAIAACEEKEGKNRCKCVDNDGQQVIDTMYYMEYDQAYQLCEGKEGSQNIWKCECEKLY